jgi:hypothetical protein
VDLFEQLRREHEFGVGTIASVAAKFAMHQRIVRPADGQRAATEAPLPPRAKPKLGFCRKFPGRICDTQGSDWALACAPPDSKF